MQDSETSATGSDHQPSVWSWLKHPWLLLILGGATTLALWVGIGVWIEHRRAIALSQLVTTPGIDVHLFANRRNPIWLPGWLGDRMNDDWRPGVIDTISVGVLQPITVHQLDLLDRQPNIDSISFRDLGEASVQALLQLCERHHFTCLDFDRPRQLTSQHYEALARNTSLSGLWKLKGPFDQTAMNALGQMQQLTSLRLTGPLSTGSRISSLGRLERLIWYDSQLTDEQFSGLAFGSHLDMLYLHDTQLTARSWKRLASMQTGILSLESPHIDDSLADELAQNTELGAVMLRGGQFSDRALRKLLESGGLELITTETRDLSLKTAELIGSSTSLSSFTVYGGPHVNDEFLKVLINEQTFSLRILSSSITDAGVEYLKECPNLMELGLSNSRITDRSLTLLRAVPNLRRLDLRNTAITDDGLRRWSFPGELSGTRSLHLGGTQVSTAAAKELQQRDPSAFIYGIDGIEAGPDEKQWFPPLGPIDRP